METLFLTGMGGVENFNFVFIDWKNKDWELQDWKKQKYYAFGNIFERREINLEDIYYNHEIYLRSDDIKLDDFDKRLVKKLNRSLVPISCVFLCNDNITDCDKLINRKENIINNLVKQLGYNIDNKMSYKVFMDIIKENSFILTLNKEYATKTMNDDNSQNNLFIENISKSFMNINKRLLKKEILASIKDCRDEYERIFRPQDRIWGAMKIMCIRYYNKENSIETEINLAYIFCDIIYKRIEKTYFLYGKVNKTKKIYDLLKERIKLSIYEYIDEKLKSKDFEKLWESGFKLSGYTKSGYSSQTNYVNCIVRDILDIITNNIYSSIYNNETNIHSKFIDDIFEKVTKNVEFIHSCYNDRNLRVKWYE